MGKEKLHGLTAKKIRKLFKIKKYPDGRYDLIHADSATILVRRSLCVGPNLFKIGDTNFTTARLVYIYFFGEIPYNHCIKFKDGDSSNFEPSNFLCTDVRSGKKKKGRKEEKEDSISSIDSFFKEIDSEEEEVKEERISVKRNSLEIVKKEKTKELLKIGDIFSYNGEIFIFCKDGICANLTTGSHIDVRVLFNTDDEDEIITRDYIIHSNPKLVL